MKPTRNCVRRNKYMAIFGVPIFILGIILLFLKLWLMELLATSIIVLKPNSLIERAWRKIPDVSSDVYLFNWTNHEDFHNFSIKPKFQQVGPYRFKQDIEKVDVIWNNNNTVTYNQLRYFHFDEKNTNKNLSKPITTINMITLCLSHYVRNMNYFLKKLISAYLTTSAPHVHNTRTAKQFLLEGFNDFVIDMADYLPFISPEIPRFNKFTLLSFVNASKSIEGIMNIQNGADRIFESRNWNFLNATHHYNGSCSKVHGSAGELFSNTLSKDYTGIFLSALCRHVELDFEEEVVVDGIMGYKYSVGNRMLDNGTLIPGNECYCDGDCIPSGVINISSCLYGFPVFMSLPNFYGADPVYLNDVEGLHPEKEKHEAYIVLEPKTGIPLKATVRMQLNLLVHSIEDISVFEDARQLIFPVIWVEQRNTLPGNLNLFLKIYLMLPQILTGIASFLITCGLLLTSVSFKPIFFSWFEKIQEQKQHTPAIPEEIPLQHNDNIVEKSNIKFVNIN